MKLDRNNKKTIASLCVYVLCPILLFTLLLDFSNVFTTPIYEINKNLQRLKNTKLPSDALTYAITTCGNNDDRCARFYGIFSSDAVEDLKGIVKNKKIKMIWFSSGGGDLKTIPSFLKIINDNKINIVVKNGDSCVSSCALLFSQIKTNNLNIEPDAFFGFHAITKNSDIKELSPGVVISKTEILTIEDQVGVFGSTNTQAKQNLVAMLRCNNALRSPIIRYVSWQVLSKVLESASGSGTCLPMLNRNERDMAVAKYDPRMSSFKPIKLSEDKVIPEPEDQSR